jgi:ketosteroid isomerase-like protein
MHFQRGTFAAFSLLVAMSLAQSAEKPASDQTAEVEKLDRELSAAGVRGDLDASSRLIADDAIFVHESGKTTTKADNLEFMKSPDYKLESENFEEIHSKQFGDTVVLWGRVTAQGIFKQKPFRDTVNFTDVWQRHNGNWEQVFTRATAVAKP